MAGRLLRRSGIAVGLIAELVDWKPDLIIQVGVGNLHKEVEVFQEEWPRCKLVGFEPNHQIVEDIEDEYPGDLYCIAISDCEGEATLHYRDKHKDGSSLYPYKDTTNQKTSHVFTQTLDSGFPRTEWTSGAHVMLWLDCEGNELKALHGAEDLISRPEVEFINVETTGKPYCDGWCTPVEIFDFLSARDFWLLWLHTQRSSAGQCDAIYVRRHLFDPVFCPIPQEVKRYREVVND